LKAVGSGIFEGIVQAFTWTDWGKAQNTSVSFPLNRRKFELLSYWASIHSDTTARLISMLRKKFNCPSYGIYLRYYWRNWSRVTLISCAIYSSNLHKHSEYVQISDRQVSWMSSPVFS